MENEEILDLPVIGRAGTLHSVDEASRTFDVLWTTGAQVRRYSWARDEEFDEELVVALETHDFEPIRQVQWRNSNLNFGSIDALRQSLDSLP